LRKWSPREKYFKYDNFLTPFCLLLSVKCFGQILRKSVKSTYPINSLKVGTFYERSNARFSLKKVCKQFASPQEIMSPLETASQWRNRTSWRQLQWVRISREKWHYSHVFNLLTGKTKEKQSWQWVKLPKARGNPASRNETRQPKENQSNQARTFGLLSYPK